MKKLLTAIASVLIALPVTSFAQNQPRAGAVITQAPGEASVTEALQLQGKVKSIDTYNRKIHVVGPNGGELVFAVPQDAPNYNQIRVGDLVTLTYVHAVALEFRQVKASGLRERIVSSEAARAKPGQMPAAAVERTVTVIGDIVVVNPKAQTVTLRGTERTVELKVNDPAVLKQVKVGNQVEAVFTEAISLEVTKNPNK